MAGTPNPETISTKQERIAQLARRMPGVALRTLAHHIDIEWLKEAHRRTRKDGAPGIDGQTAEEYARELETNLASLLDRAKSGDGYRAPPVRRAYIPKADGRSVRPLGIPTFEDKILQRAVVMALEPVYEQDFLPCSFGCRPGKSAHDAIAVLDDEIHRVGRGWILEADIRSYFDAVPHEQLRTILQQRVRDGVLLRLIGKWLNAGVWEQGTVHRPDAGTPQGGVISPLLANIYLHEVLDVWFEHQVKPRLRGRAVLVRYVDDFVIFFDREDDARRVQTVLPERLGKYGLHLHPEKTRLVRFDRPRKDDEGHDRSDGPRSFDFLGFTFYWGRSKKGTWVLKQKTARDRFSRAVQRANAWCKANRHLPIAEQHAALRRKLTGHYQYYGVSGNYRRLASLRLVIHRLWFKWLCRRSSRSRRPWDWMMKLLKRFALPMPAVRRLVRAANT